MKLLLSSAFIICSLFCFAQPTEEKIVAALDSFSIYRPQEKSYAMTDKNTYIAGETVFLKAFTSLFEKPGILSSVLYITLSDESGKVVDKKMLPLKNGSTAGNIFLDASLPQGNYNISAYTLWMLNHPEFIFSKKINILNTSSKKAAVKSPVVLSNKIMFFPEGGNLIAGVNNVVAFKAIDENNQPAKVSGTITDNNNKVIAQLNTSHDGMGTVSFTPVAGTNYNCVVTTTTGATLKSNLPSVMEEGVSISADNSNAGKTFIKVIRAEKNKINYNDLLLVAQMNYKVVYMAKLNIDEGLDAASINKKNLPAGIMQITLMTKDGKPLSERLVFVGNHSINNSLLSVTVDNGKRKKNILSVDLSAFNNIDAAISVVNADADQKANDQNIVSSLLMTSDIKGFVNNPAFYFKDKETATLDKLDLVMLTNGWRRFDWNDIMNNKYPPLHYPFETGLSITGKVMKVNGKTPLKEGKINFIIKGDDSTKIMSEAKVNEKSEFVVSNINFLKNATVYYQGTNQQHENALVSVTLDPTYFDTVKRSAVNIYEEKAALAPTSSFIKNMIDEKEKKDAKDAKMLQEIVLRSKKLTPEDSATKVYASPLFEMSDQTLVLEPSDAVAYDVWQYMQRKVPALLVDKSDGMIHVSLGRYNGLDYFNQEGTPVGVQFFLNEVAVTADIVDAINPGDIGLIKIYKGAAGIALGAPRGAISLYTIKGRSTRDWRDRGFDFFKKAGYSVGREFYNMDYSKLNPESEFSDVRPTLYWNPSITVKDGKANIEFYNDDIAKKFRIVIEGMDKNGKLLSIEKTTDLSSEK